MTNVHLPREHKHISTTHPRTHFELYLSIVLIMYKMHIRCFKSDRTTLGLSSDYPLPSSFHEEFLNADRL